MEHAGGYESDMGAQLDLDEDTLDRMLDAPGAGLSVAPALAALLSAAAAVEHDPGHSFVSGESAAVSAFREAVRRPASGVHARRKPRRTRVAMARLVVAGLAAGAVAGGMAAAATGSLPSSLPGDAERAARTLLSDLGLPVQSATEQTRKQVGGTGGLSGDVDGAPADASGGTSVGGSVGSGPAGVTQESSSGAGAEAKTWGKSAGGTDKPAKKGRSSDDVSRPNAAVPVPNHGVGNPKHPPQGPPNASSAGDDRRGGGRRSVR